MREVGSMSPDMSLETNMTWRVLGLAVKTRYG